MVEDLTLALRQLKPASYDIVMLSVVLSSMPACLTSLRSRGCSHLTGL